MALNWVEARWLRSESRSGCDSRISLRISRDERLLGWANGVLSTVLAVITPDIGPEVQEVKVQWLWVVVGDPDRLSLAHFGNEETDSGAVRGSRGRSLHLWHHAVTSSRGHSYAETHPRHWRVASTLTRGQCKQSSTDCKAATAEWIWLRVCRQQ